MIFWTHTLQEGQTWWSQMKVQHLHGPLPFKKFYIQWTEQKDQSMFAMKINKIVHTFDDLSNSESRLNGLNEFVPRRFWKQPTFGSFFTGQYDQ